MFAANIEGQPGGRVEHDAPHDRVAGQPLRQFGVHLADPVQPRPLRRGWYAGPGQRIATTGSAVSATASHVCATASHVCATVSLVCATVSLVCATVIAVCAT